MAPKLNYYLISDNDVQWFTRVVAMNWPELRVVESKDLPSAVCGDFLSSIWERDIAFSNKEIDNQTWSGWSLSRYEYDRVLRIIELHPSAAEYEKLRNL